MPHTQDWLIEAIDGSVQGAHAAFDDLIARYGFNEANRIFQDACEFMFKLYGEDAS